MTPSNQPDHAQRIAERTLDLCLLVAVLDTAYLAQRYVRLREGLVVAGTGLCSLTDRIDCDPVLLSPEARAFFVPNAILGLGFFLGASVFSFVLGARHPNARRTRALWLAIGLGIASLVTLRFFMLLVRLPTLCPVCPWNHVLTYVAFLAAVVVCRVSRDTGPRPTPSFLAGLIACAALPFALLSGAWWLLSGR